MARTKKGFSTVGLFAGIGGLEAGLHRAGHVTSCFCEIDPGAIEVLETRFPLVPVETDVRRMKLIPRGTELVTAGFPCQDISQAGTTRGLDGDNSGLVHEVFRLLANSDVPHVLFENVSFMLSLAGGAVMRIICDELDRLGYRWAYRVLDTRAFGLPQRRERVFLFASRETDPSMLLFQQDAGSLEVAYQRDLACGFYWTEGTRGLGWAVDAIPTLKGGSTIGIASPPAIWLPDGRVVKPDVRDGERLQGFEPDWTKPAEKKAKPGHRWKLVGNAVSVNTAEWIGRTILARPKALKFGTSGFDQRKSWPRAAFGGPDQERLKVQVSAWPVHIPSPPLGEFLHYEPHPLSLRALDGFLGRLKASTLRGYPPEFIPALEHFRELQAQREEDPPTRCAAS